MLKPAPTSSLSSTNSSNRNIAARSKAEVSIWVRLGIPIGLALLAGGLNVTAIRQQLQPSQAYVLTEDLPVGTLLKAEHIRAVDVAGNFDRSLLATTDDLYQANDSGSLLSLSESLDRMPRILSKRMTKGELIYRSSLSGRATAQRGTEIITIPRSLISGGGQQLQPGQLVHFAVQRRRGSTDLAPTYIGPFRVALEERTAQSKAAEQKGSVALMYQLDEKGARDESARILHDAALQESDYRLVVIEKYYREPSSKPTSPAKTTAVTGTASDSSRSTASARLAANGNGSKAPSDLNGSEKK